MVQLCPPLLDRKNPPTSEAISTMLGSESQTAEFTMFPPAPMPMFVQWIVSAARNGANIMPSPHTNITSNSLNDAQRVVVTFDPPSGWSDLLSHYRSWLS